jgi:putative PepSY-like beta-lactamase-inhibitor
MNKNWMAAIAGTLLFAACGNNGTETTYNDKSTATAPTSLTNPPAVIPEYNPPDNVRTSFQTKYPGASDVTWSPYKTYDRINWEWTGWPSMDTSYYAVNYTVDNKPHMSWWDKLGKWIGSSSTIEDSTMLPDPVKKTIKNNYAGYKITSIDEENDKNRTAYEIKLEKGDAHARILVDRNGKILKKDAKA